MQRDYEKTLGVILDTGTEMIRCGAETHRVENSLYHLLQSYEFVRSDVWVVPTNIQATVVTPDGDTLTQVRHVRGVGIDFSRLDCLAMMTRRVIQETPPIGKLEEELQLLNRQEERPTWEFYLAGALSAMGFGVFFHCDAFDAVAAVLVSVLITFLGRTLRRWENNPLIQNFLISSAAELLILALVKIGIGHHAGYITVGVAMLLISALGTTNGLRDLIHLDTLSGMMNITASVTGALGIALGMSAPLRFLGYREIEIVSLPMNVGLQLAACTVGCTGFAMWFHVRRDHIHLCAIGAFVCWTAYLMFYRALQNSFLATIGASAVCAFSAQIMARAGKSPSIIFMTVSVFPLIPGAALYYCMYGLVTRNREMAFSRGVEMIMVCFGIVFGFMVMEVIARLVRMEKDHKRNSRCRY